MLCSENIKYCSSAMQAPTETLPPSLTNSVYPWHLLNPTILHIADPNAHANLKKIESSSGKINFDAPQQPDRLHCCDSVRVILNIKRDEISNPKQEIQSEFDAEYCTNQDQ